MNYRFNKLGQVEFKPPNVGTDFLRDIKPTKPEDDNLLSPAEDDNLLSPAEDDLLAPAKPAGQPGQSRAPGQAWQSLNSVKEMQKAMARFSDMMQKIQLEMWEEKREQNKKTDKTGGALDGTSSFLYWLLQKSAFKRGAMEGGSGKVENTNGLESLIDSIKLVGGSHTGARTFDGLWGPNTNAALNDICAFAENITGFASKMGLDSDGSQAAQVLQQSSAKIAELRTMLSDKPPSIKEQQEKAPIITAMLDNYVTNIFKSFTSNFFSSDKYKDELSQDQPLITQKGKIALTEDDKNVMNQTKTFRSITPKMDGVHFMNLYSLDQFKQFILDNFGNKSQNNEELRAGIQKARELF